MDKKDVLQAIMNVKKYTQNLKKNASFVSEIQSDESAGQSAPEMISSIQTYFHRNYTNDQSISPSLIPNASTFRQQKSKKLNSTSISRVKRNMHSTIDNLCFQKIDFQKQRSVQLNIRNPVCQLFKKSDDHQQLIVNPSNNQQEQLIIKLKHQVIALYSQIEKYQKAMLLIKQKYIKMQQAYQQKVSVDHFVDVLKQQLNKQRVIDTLFQEKSSKYLKIIQKQRNVIDSFNKNILNISQKLTEIHSNQINQLSKITKQNYILRQMLLLSNPPQIHDQQIKKKMQQLDKLFQNQQKHFDIRLPCLNVNELEDQWKQPQTL